MSVIKLGRPLKPVVWEVNEDGCHVVTSHYHDYKGYVRCSIGKEVLMHRAVYAKQYGEIPKGMHILHTCDNPSCINLEHLFMGTNIDNVKDKISKGRAAQGITSGVNKLNESQAREIYLSVGKTNEELGKEFGVAPNTVSCVRTGHTWKHITKDLERKTI